MRLPTCIFLLIFLTACSTLPEATYDGSYTSSEIAILTAEHFDVQAIDAKAALGPAFKKYGAPHAYIDGLMSSIDNPHSNYLYGSGHFQTKLSLKEHTFWRVDGDNLTGHLVPVKTAHLVYETLRLDPLSDKLVFSETLSKRGQKFTIFERKMGDEIIITLHKSQDLPKTSLESVNFFRD